MNADTTIVVCGYAGDANQIAALMPWYVHHARPVVVMSPEDAKIVPGRLTRRYGVQCRYGGKRAYTGADSLLRQKRHMEMMLEYPTKFFLMNDSDSFCVAAEIPRYVYAEPDVLWSNEVSDDVGHVMPPGYSYPRLAFQPPYFASREVLKALIAAHEKTGTDYPMQFIDHYMMRLAVNGGIKHKQFHNCVSCQTRDANGIAHMMDSVRRRGSVFIHAVKDLAVAKQITKERAAHLRQ